VHFEHRDGTAPSRRVGRVTGASSTPPPGLTTASPLRCRPSSAESTSSTPPTTVGRHRLHRPHRPVRTRLRGPLRRRGERSSLLTRQAQTAPWSEFHSRATSKMRTWHPPRSAPSPRNWVEFLGSRHHDSNGTGGRAAQDSTSEAGAVCTSWAARKRSPAKYCVICACSRLPSSGSPELTGMRPQQVWQESLPREPNSALEVSYADPLSRSLPSLRIARRCCCLGVGGPDVGDAGLESGCWRSATRGTMGSMVVVVDVPDLECC